MTWHCCPGGAPTLLTCCAIRKALKLSPEGIHYPRMALVQRGSAIADIFLKLGVQEARGAYIIWDLHCTLHWLPNRCKSCASSGVSWKSEEFLQNN